MLTTFTDSKISLRSVDVDGEPWFLARDACDALGLTDTSMALKPLDPDEKVKPKSGLGLRGRAPWLISESGLYRLMMRSDKPQARPFQRWVTREVLPAIRKRGAYMTDAVVDDDEIKCLVDSHLRGRAPLALGLTCDESSTKTRWPPPTTCSRYTFARPGPYPRDEPGLYALIFGSQKAMLDDDEDKQNVSFGLRVRAPTLLKGAGAVRQQLDPEDIATSTVTLNDIKRGRAP